MSAKWMRVNKAFKCPICDHDSWCTVCPELQICLCMRTDSDRPSKNKMGGHIHPLGTQTKIPKRPMVEEPPRIDADAVMRSFSERQWPEMQSRFAIGLGVSMQSLASVGCAWAVAHNAWAFPMRDGLGNCVGIRLRTEQGKKFAVTGSRQGIFLPHCHPQSTVYLVEGPTNVAAALTIGLFAIGEPSCNACINYTQVAINRLHIKRAVIVVDNDSPGVRGAKALASELQIPCCALILPAKDMREAVSLGMTKELMESLTTSLVWHQPRT